MTRILIKKYTSECVGFFLFFLLASQGFSSEGAYQTFVNEIDTATHFPSRKKGLADGERQPPERVRFSSEQIEASKKINHIIVIMQENWSFDGLYGKFPGANGIANAKKENKEQIDLIGQTYPELLLPINTKDGKPYKRFPDPIPNGPFDLFPYIPMNMLTGDAVHRFYQEQYQINGGMMNRFAAWSNSGGFVMSYYDISNTAMGQLAKEFVLCDHWFHSCYGGSMCGVIWLFTAQMPVWPKASNELIARLYPSGIMVKDGVVSPDGYAINDAEPFYFPYHPSTPEKKRVPPQSHLTIGDLLSEKGISWKWYAEGWNQALQGKADSTFAYHHQAPSYFRQFAPGTKERKDHLFDLSQFFDDLEKSQVPSVSFIRSLDKHSEHPGKGSLLAGLNWCADLIHKIQKSSVWNDCVIIVTYDENGGRWDHVAPPIVDRFGPGTRVPTLIISPFAKKGFVDSTSYETVSILKFIEQRFDLRPLSNRDAAANNILNAFDFSK